MDPEQNFDEAELAEIADALFYLAKHSRYMSSVELSAHIIDEFSQSLEMMANGAGL